MVTTELVRLGLNSEVNIKLQCTLEMYKKWLSNLLKNPGASHNLSSK